MSDAVVVRPGDGLVPPGVERTFANRTGSPVRILNVHAPAGFDVRLRGSG